MLKEISTRWPAITDPAQFAIRYGPAIRGYLAVFLKNPHDVEDVCQAFLLRLVERGFEAKQIVRGRFRDYLIAVVRNAALSHLRRKPLGEGAGSMSCLAAPNGMECAADREWLAGWRRCVLASVWEALENHQRQSPGNLCFTVLRVLTDHPQEDSRSLAARTTALTGHSIRPDAFRKQVSRARRLFAELLVKEVAHSLEAPTPDDIEAELSHVDLLRYVRPYLPALFGRRSPDASSE